MSQHDDFVRATLAAMLQPGEVVLAMGWMAPPSFEWREKYERYFAAGTTSRLIVIQSSQTMSMLPKLTSEGVIWLDYASMREVSTHRFAPLADNLVVDSAYGKHAYCVPSMGLILSAQMDGQKAFSELYLQWLARHVATGSFRTAEGAHAAAAEWHDPRALDDANVRFAPTSMAARRRRQQRRIKWPYTIAIASLLVVLMGAKQTGEAHGVRQRADAQQILFLGLALVLGFLVLGLVLNARRRAADQAAARATTPPTSQPR